MIDVNLHLSEDEFRALRLVVGCAAANEDPLASHYFLRCLKKVQLQIESTALQEQICKDYERE